MKMRANWAILTLVGVALSGASAAAQTDADWLTPVSGDWLDATKWSTNPIYPKNDTPSFGNRYNVSIDAAGSPYQVSLAQSMFVERITIDSPDATLKVSAGTLDTVHGIHVERGRLLLDGATLYLDRLSAGPEGVLTTGATNVSSLYGVTLAGELQAEKYLTISNTLTLEDGIARFSAGNIYGGADVVGTGEWVLKSSLPESSSFPYRIYFYEQGSSEMRIGPGVTVRSAGEGVILVPGPAVINNPGIVVNQGTILAETDGGSLYISDFRNEGTIRVANGDYFSAGFRGAVGHVELGSESWLRASDAPAFNLPIVVGNGALLDINAEQQATAAQPLQLAEGGRIRFGTGLSLVPVASTGGQVELGGAMTLAQLNSLNVTGPAAIAFAGGSIDLEGATFDYTTVHPNLAFEPSLVKNGTLTGPATQFGDFVTFDDVVLDVPLFVTSNTLLLRTGDTLAQPATVSGGKLVLGTGWQNLGGINVTGGVLQFEAPAAVAGDVDMSGGSLVVAHDTTLADLLALDFGTPDRIVMGNDVPYHYYGGTLDLQSQTLDLDAFDYNWFIDDEGGIRNGEVVGTHTGRALGYLYGTIQNLTIRGAKLSGQGTIFSSTLMNVWSDGSLALSQATLVDSRVDGSVIGSNIVLQGENEIHGRLGGSIRFDPGATLAGDGFLGADSGRSNHDVFTILEPEYTIGGSFDLVSATVNDSSATVAAVNTNLRVEGNILAGYTSSFGSPPTDSWTFHVASLHTAGRVNVTNDGRMSVDGGPWRHSGDMLLEGGSVEAPEITIEVGASVVGWGTMTVGAGGLKINGVLAPGEVKGQLAVTGDVEFDSTAGLSIELRGHDNSNPTNLQFDRLQVAGIAALAGALDVTLAPSFFQQPLAVGNQFAILNATALTGEFDLLSVNFGHITFDLLYTSTSVVLEIADIIRISGDYNGDGTVDAADYTVWRNGLGTTYAAADYEVWTSHFGETAPGSGSAGASPSQAAVPEPATWVLLFAAATIAAIRRQ